VNYTATIFLSYLLLHKESKQGGKRGTIYRQTNYNVIGDKDSSCVYLNKENAAQFILSEEEG